MRVCGTTGHVEATGQRHPGCLHHQPDCGIHPVWTRQLAPSHIRGETCRVLSLFVTHCIHETSSKTSVKTHNPLAYCCLPATKASRMKNSAARQSITDSPNSKREHPAKMTSIKQKEIMSVWRTLGKLEITINRQLFNSQTNHRVPLSKGRLWPRWAADQREREQKPKSKFSRLSSSTSP